METGGQFIYVDCNQEESHHYEFFSGNVWDINIIQF